MVAGFELFNGVVEFEIGVMAARSGDAATEKGVRTPVCSFRRDPRREEFVMLDS